MRRTKHRLEELERSIPCRRGGATLLLFMSACGSTSAPICDRVQPGAWRLQATVARDACGKRAGDTFQLNTSVPERRCGEATELYFLITAEGCAGDCRKGGAYAAKERTGRDVCQLTCDGNVQCTLELDVRELAN